MRTGLRQAGRGVARPERRRPAAALAAWVALALTLGGVDHCAAAALDSLRSFVDGDSLFVDFAIPIRSLRAARVDAALEEQGLSVDCVISTEVRKKAGFLNHTVVKNVMRRTLSYSRWYEEYVLAENARELSTHKSYYASLDRFRRFSRLRIVDLGILEPGQEYSVRFDLSLVPRLPSEKAGGRDVSLAGVGVPRDMVDLLRGKGSLLSIRLESPAFKNHSPPERLFGFDAARARTGAGAGSVPRAAAASPEREGENAEANRPGECAAAGALELERGGAGEQRRAVLRTP